MLKAVRDKCIEKITNLVSSADTSLRMKHSDTLLQVIIGSSELIKANSFPDLNDKIELYSRSLIHKLHTQLMSTIVSK